MGMFDYEKIRNEVENYLSWFAEEYNVDAIMADLMGYSCDGISTITDVAYADFLTIIESHEK